MNYNTDGFNERHNYISNQTDMNRLKKNGPSNFDNSLAKMHMDENKPNINTVNNDKRFIKEEVKGSKENFILRNKNIMNANKNINPNNPVSNAMNRNMFKFKNK